MVQVAIGRAVPPCCFNCGIENGLLYIKSPFLFWEFTILEMAGCEWWCGDAVIWLRSYGVIWLRSYRVIRLRSYRLKRS
jgi:hypothetical protein